jgi:predicted GNAT family N-acyltransferase
VEIETYPSHKFRLLVGLQNHIFVPMQLENTRIVHAEEDADFDQIFTIREAVFERELGLAEEKQIDGFDHVAHHYIMVYNNRAVGVSRWRVTLGGNIRLDRLAVLKEYRSKGFGKALMQKMLTHIPKNKTTYLECLVDQAGFFADLGFVVVGDEFDFQGFPHLRMELKS